ncbi:TPA: hypothetical protein HA235_00255 [Candidatus Woesearchaeota archaeon]|nr:hypothetical protein [Candidatus Woesearchaeota archaeon]HIH31117.1 hypothetical protein [Candidatus Woesearchaeota archaeon]HIH55068.1 hypothetical protein [Candidatus Woesearchaeota archaeon]HIJ01317.1 hypothetical protein [Candidatus Woesearchaeota archaeon]HIJ13747.1 hypothetical protein [Candidatus Woesearchaeota archaeon]
MGDNMDQNTSSQVPEQKSDLSSTTLVILVLLTLTISIIGTWSVLNEMSNIKVSPPPKASSAQVSLQVNPPAEPKIVPVTGNIALNVLKN